MSGPNTVNFPVGIQIPIPMWLVDANGNQITTFGGGTQYTDGGTPPTHPVGGTIEFNNSGTWATVSASAGLPVNIVAGSSSGTQYTDGNAPPANPVGTALVFDQGGTWKDAGADQPLPVQLMTAASTALAADQSNTILKASLYVKKSAAGDTVLALGSATSANSVPVVIASDQGAIPIQHGNVVDAGNSSTATLTGNSVFTGTSTSSLSYSALSIEVFADQASAASGLSIQQSQNGTNWDIADTFTVSASTAFNTMVNLVGQFYRVVYTNGSTNQGTFRLQTVKMTADPVQARTLTASGNMKVAVQEALPAGTNVIGSTTIQATSGTALAADSSNTRLQISLYGKNSAAGDTALSVDSSGRVAENLNFAGTAASVNNGTTDAGTQRVTLSSDSTGQVKLATGANTIGALTANQSTNTVQLNGNTVSVDSGTSGNGTQRVIVAGAATGTKTNVASSASSVTILASNTSRKGATFYNDSTQICYLDLSGGTASSSSYSVQVPSQGFFELPGPTIYNGAVTGIWASANGSMRVTEFS